MSNAISIWSQFEALRLQLQSQIFSIIWNKLPSPILKYSKIHSCSFRIAPCLEYVIYAQTGKLTSGFCQFYFQFICMHKGYMERILGLVHRISQRLEEIIWCSFSSFDITCSTARCALVRCT